MLSLTHAFTYRYGKDAMAAINYNYTHQKDNHNPTSAMTLAQDLTNIPAHIFGEHSRCKSYFCKGQGSSKNTFSSLKSSPAGKELLLAFHRLSNRSQRLIYNVTSNFAECFMSVMTKCISGKRVNYAQRGSYTFRVRSAALAFNNGAFWLARVFSKNREVCKLWANTKKFFDDAKTRGSHSVRPLRIRCKSQKKIEKAASKDYGPDAVQGTMSDLEISAAVLNLIASLQVSETERDSIQIATIGQSFNENWRFERRNRLTASNAGRIYKLQDHTSNCSTLKAILHPQDLSRIENIKNGINLEPEAKRSYTLLTGSEVVECGLFVYVENGTLAASPDGLVEKDGILEVKCINCKPEDVPNRPDKFLQRVKPSDELQINKKHKYYYQIIMQLYVTGKLFCDFFVYHKPKDDKDNLIYFFRQRVEKNDATDLLWEDMEKKLTNFFSCDMAPEIVNPMFTTTGKFREPEYRRLAITAKQESKASKASSKNITSVPIAISSENSVTDVVESCKKLHL